METNKIKKLLEELEELEKHNCDEIKFKGMTFWSFSDGYGSCAEINGAIKILEYISKWQV